MQTTKNKNLKISFLRLFILISISLIFIFAIYKATFFAGNIFSNYNSSTSTPSVLRTASPGEATLTSGQQQDPSLGKVPKAEGVSTSSVTHIATPDIVRGIYMSSYAASSQTFRNDLIKFLETTALNTIIIDVKDNDGSIVWNEKERMASSTLKDFIKLLHSKDIYVIARIAVFEDPKFAKENPDEAIKTNENKIWKNRKGISWVDPASQKMWNHILELAKTSYHEYGFDEINFDYVRYPTDGDMKSAIFPISNQKYSLKNASGTIVKKFEKREVIKSFFEYLNQELRVKENIKISADVFGMTTIASDDFGIGQMLTDAMNNFDFISPMVYPSHFYPGTLNYKVPDLYPYEVIYWSMGNALLRSYYQDHDFNIKNKINKLENSTSSNSSSTKSEIEKLNLDFGSSTFKATNNLTILKNEISKLQSSNNNSFIDLQKKLRPWYQDFDMNNIDYGVKSVSDQIRAGNDLGTYSFLLWDASNKYTRGVNYDK